MRNMNKSLCRCLLFPFFCVVVVLRHMGGMVAGERRKKHRKEAQVYFGVDGEEGYYIGSTEWPEERQHEHERSGKRIIEEFATTHETRYGDEDELIELAERMGIPLTNSHRKHHRHFLRKLIRKWIKT
jgi:hypothetical protein